KTTPKKLTKTPPKSTTARQPSLLHHQKTLKKLSKHQKLPNPSPPKNTAFLSGGGVGEPPFFWHKRKRFPHKKHSKIYFSSLN
ncbi:MAG: hypothetical protein IJ165_05920, partial [Proteobacteria bacterium]|nr:hypothetical protein [Pseudomonadota bacterium]